MHADGTAEGHPRHDSDHVDEVAWYSATLSG
jgi:hypothetical protein